MMVQLSRNYGFLTIVICLVNLTFAKVERESCKDFFQVSIKGEPISFESELQTVTQNNLKRAIGKTNDKIGRRSNLINPNVASDIMSRLSGLGMYRLEGGSNINCFIGVDNASNRLLIVDSNRSGTEYESLIFLTSSHDWFSDILYSIDNFTEAAVQNMPILSGDEKCYSVPGY